MITNVWRKRHRLHFLVLLVLNVGLLVIYNNLENLTAEVRGVATESYSGSVGLENLQPASRYLARVRAKNSYGFNSFSDDFQFSTFSNATLQIDPKHQKSVSASSSLLFSFWLGVLCLLLFMLR